VRTNQSFAHTGTQRTGWATSIQRNSNSARTVLNRIDRFAAVARRLGTVTLESMDAVEMIDRYSVADGLIYADPPYLVSTRRGRR
jgi:DNA adenine methylase